MSATSKKFSCALCEKQYASKESMGLHKYKMHSYQKSERNETYFSCEFGERDFVTEQRLREHLDKQSSFSCLSCDRTFPYRHSLTHITSGGQCLVACSAIKSFPQSPMCKGRCAA